MTLPVALLAIALLACLASFVAFTTDRPRLGWALVAAGLALQAWVHLR